MHRCRARWWSGWPRWSDNWLRRARRSLLANGARYGTAFAGVCLILFGCAETPPKDGWSEEPTRYVVERPEGLPADASDLGAYARYVLSVVRDNAYFAERVDWSEAELQAAALATDARSTRELRDGLNALLSGLGDGHTRLAPPPLGAAGGATWNEPTGEMLGSVAYVRLPSFPSLDPDDEVRYARSGREIVADLADRACGWILDLRDNEGGNLYPMLAAVAPLLPVGPVLGYESRRGETEWVERTPDAAITYHRRRFTLHDSSPEVAADSVAILIGPRTRSSGEFVGLAFVGREQTRFFGLPSAGALTSPTTFAVPEEGVVLYVATAAGVDRNGRHTDMLDPNERVVDRVGDPATRSRSVAAAQQWLSTTGKCEQQ